MGKFESAIKTSVSRRIQRGATIKEAFRNLKTDLFKAEIVWEKEIDEVLSNAQFEKRETTQDEKDTVSRLEFGLNSDRQKRLEAEELEKTNWTP